MSVYKLTCAETGKVYFGSTGHDINHRRSKGWYHCTCKDFINPKMEVLEHIEDTTERLNKELEYIQNNDCVNKSGKGLDKSPEAKARKKEADTLYAKRIIEEKKFYCDLCQFAFPCLGKLNKHYNSYRHKLRLESFEKYGDKWKEHYLQDNKKRYNENRKKKLWDA